VRRPAAVGGNLYRPARGAGRVASALTSLAHGFAKEIALD